jgi:hypothetical protein
MGYKHPDSWSPVQWREHFETAQSMLTCNWRVRSVCEVCRTKLRTPLAATIRLHGPAFSLWNRRPACLVDGCTGRASYEALPPRCSKFFELKAWSKDRDPDPRD